MDYGHEEVKVKHGKDPRIFDIMSEVGRKLLLKLTLSNVTSICVCDTMVKTKTDKDLGPCCQDTHILGTEVQATFPLTHSMLLPVNSINYVEQINTIKPFCSADLEKIYLRSQILECPSIGEYWKISCVPVLLQNVIFMFARTC